MLILKVISRLLDYPSAECFASAGELVDVVKATTTLSEDKCRKLTDFINDLCGRELYDAQERYDLLFDRGRALSLLLFEHVHGESRDRGQAMVELIKVYNSRGFELDSSQLPDYLPLYLEFLSEQDDAYACEWLGDICHLLATLSERLINRECNYSILFDSLIEVCGYAVDRTEIAEIVKNEERDDSMAAIDKEWEDKEVRFDEPVAESCPDRGMNVVNGAVEQKIIRQVAVK